MQDVKVAVVRGAGAPFQIESVQMDDPRTGEVLVKVSAVGVCHTDMFAQGLAGLGFPAPIVLGHEGAGVVAKVGAGVTKVAVGDHVVLTFASCGQCLNCQDGAPTYCNNFGALNLAGVRADGSTTMQQNGTPLHGSFFGQSSFGTYAIANERNVVKVPKDVPIELLGPLGCGIQTGAGSIMNALRPEIGSTLAVFGTGAVGMAAIMAARAVGCGMIIGVDVKPNRLALALELGATHVINAADGDPVEAIRELTGGGVRYSLEATGIIKVMRQAVDVLLPRGVCGVVGSPPPQTELPLDPNHLLFGRTVRGIIEGESVPDVFIPILIELYKQGRFPFDKLIRQFPFEQINEAIHASESGEVLKPVLVM
ncbi:MAG: NAD(P)-dependent alcohol dehydrogenase [Chloroflexi bacterium CFX4]|nr:NAD(P)-dependent alcohol dehydrogenase [Chloroflexi bacterium CFX4]MDL1922452.1 NAD(P)-dependent alcohol dehydrogenase [Chloroflexi bacterium CFX3]